jgi:hypothetical protein
MTLHPSVLLGLQAGALRDHLEGSIRRLGYMPSVASDGAEALALLRVRTFAASLVDSDLPLGGRGAGAEQGDEVWRLAWPLTGRRLVLLVRRPGKALWYEALNRGVGAVLPLPPAEGMVEAALSAVTGRR